MQQLQSWFHYSTTRIYEEEMRRWYQQEILLILIENGLFITLMQTDYLRTTEFSLNFYLFIYLA